MYQYSETERNKDVHEYLTPPGLAKAMAKQIPSWATQVLDPGANNGTFGRALREEGFEGTLTGVEILSGLAIPKGYDYWYNPQDFIEWKAPKEYDAVICNPPYSKPRRGIAGEFVWKSWQILKEGGYMIFLLRASFPNARCRVDSHPERPHQGFFWKHPPRFRYTVMPRPSFYGHDKRTAQYGTKNTNTHDYDVFVWIKRDRGIYQTANILMDWRKYQC